MAQDRIPMVNVTARILDQTGRPVQRARIAMRLTTVERYCGLIVPREVTQYTDANGNAVLRVWPNELGTEGSEYLVTILHGESTSAAGCGCDSSMPVMSQRFRVVVPNTDCNLFDIADLPPYEQRGSGQVITSEVASFAAQAANAADRANTVAQAVNAAQGNIEALAQRADTANTSAQAAASQARKHEQRAQAIIDSVDGTILNFETSVVERVEKTANRLTTNATTCIKQAENAALTAIEQRSGDTLTELSKLGANVQQRALEAIAAKKEVVLAELDEVVKREREEFQEEARLFGEDFEALTERAETAAKRAGCSAASAANSATRACLCAERAEKAASDIEQAKEDTLAAARAAETSRQCAEAAATRAVNAADSSQKNAEYAAGSAKAAQESARSADCSADYAKQYSQMACDAQQAARADRVRAQQLADGMEQRLHDVAVDLLTEQVVADAVTKATDKAVAAADAAEKAKDEAVAAANETSVNAKEAARQANLAKIRAQDSQAARNASEAAQTEAAKARDEAVAARNDAIAAAATASGSTEIELATNIIRVANRVTLLELMHNKQDLPDWLQPNEPPCPELPDDSDNSDDTNCDCGCDCDNKSGFYLVSEEIEI